MKRLVVLAAFAFASVPVAAFAEEPAEEPKMEPLPETSAPEPPPPPLEIVREEAPDTTLGVTKELPREGPPRFDFFRVNIGPKIGYVTDAGYDAFSKNDVYPSFSIDATYPLLTRGRIVLAAGLAWEPGGSGAETRGVRMSLHSQRFGIPIEARFHASTGLFVFGKATPGVRAMWASVEDASSPNALSDTAWSVGADLSAGASILVGPRVRPDKRSPRFWLTPEAGWAFAQASAIRPDPGRDADDVLGTDNPTTLRSLSLEGFFWRATFGLTY